MGIKLGQFVDAVDNHIKSGVKKFHEDEKVLNQKRSQFRQERVSLKTELDDMLKNWKTK
jgi:uncharacterized protein YdcH (DUF465 family)